MAVFLHAAGFHCLTFDVRGHGANPPEALPLSAGEFGLDAAAAFRVLMDRPEVTIGAISGHSMGAIGAILAGAADPRVAAIVATSAPSDPYRLTRQTFRLAHLPLPDPIAFPLAWLTTRVYLQPRGHDVRSTSASAAFARYRGPVLLAHGDEDAVMPFAHLSRLERAALASRRGDPGAGPVETLRIAGGQHSWLYENPIYRRAVARFLSQACDGPLDPTAAGDIAAATPVERIPDGEARFEAIAESPGGIRTLIRVALPGATRPPEAIDAATGVSNAPGEP
jgi:alpha-beta hydrolase superfamily lysophospholipase